MAWFPASGLLECQTFTQSIPDLAERGRNDGVGGLYLKLVDTGDLRVMTGRLVDVSKVLDACLATWGIPACITADRWREAELEQAIEESEADRIPVVYRGQGFGDGCQDIRMFQAALLDNRVRARKDAVLRLAMQDTKLLVDPAGNTKHDRRNRRAKNDAAVAAVLAVSSGIRERDLMLPRAKARYLGAIRRTG